jgi:hypothetical protein
VSSSIYYVARHWIAHVQFENVSSILQKMEYLFDLIKPYGPKFTTKTLLSRLDYLRRVKPLCAAPVASWTGTPRTALSLAPQVRKRDVLIT